MNPSCYRIQPPHWPLMHISRLTAWSCHWANIKINGLVLSHRRCLYQTWVLFCFWRKNRVPKSGLTMTNPSTHQIKFVGCWREWGGGIPLGSVSEVGVWPPMWRRKQSYTQNIMSCGASPGVYSQDRTTTTILFLELSLQMQVKTFPLVVPHTLMFSVNMVHLWGGLTYAQWSFWFSNEQC